MKGWLVLKRHVEALHELSVEEFREMADLQAQGAKALRKILKCEKEYAMCYAEAPGFKHVHVHLVAKAPDLPEELVGPRIFAMLKADVSAVPREEIRKFCEVLQGEFRHTAAS
jgi:diadenosine tetraphosphate (Ap4A) HIT family hydrolase